MTSGIVLDCLSGEVAFPANSRPQVYLNSARLSVSREALQRLISTGGPVELEQLSAGRIHVKVQVAGIPVRVELRPLLRQGRILLELEKVHAGFVPLPKKLVMAAIGGRLPERPGILVNEENQVEIDLPLMLIGYGVTLPSPTAVEAEGSLVISAGVPGTGVPGNV